MKRLLIVTAGLGLVLAIAITADQGFGAVAQAFAKVGFGLGVVIMLRAVQLAGAGLAWWIVFPSAARSPLHTCLWVRFIREAINNLLPVAQIGGEIAGARLLTFFGIAGGARRSYSPGRHADASFHAASVHHRGPASTAIKTLPAWSKAAFRPIR